MTDDVAPPADPFAGFLTGDQSAPANPPAPPAENDPFASFLEPPEEDQTSGFGAFAHAFERGVAPALASLPAAGAGAELGAAIGAPFGGVGAVPGAIIGGLGGAIAGSTAVSAAQDWAIKSLPESWQDFLGQSQQQQELDVKLHPTETFLGGTVPFLLTMKPGFGATRAALPANATAWQKIAANPVTSHLFGGAVMGGMELGNEAISEGKPNWTNVAIATAFGTVFNRPNRIGERLTEVGAKPVRQVTGVRETPTAEPAAPEAPATPEPTVAQAGDTKVMGPGITEGVFMGTEHQAPEAAMTAQEAARTETAVLAPETILPDAGTVARQMHPEEFDEYARLSAQRDDLRAHLDAVRDPAAEVQPAEAAAIQLQINATDAQLRELAPSIAAAHRRAADVVGSEVIEPEVSTPEPIPTTNPLETTTEGAISATEGAPAATQTTIEQQAANIATDVTRQLIAAGQTEAEAKAAGTLLSHRYVTRAHRLGNTVSPESLYRSEGPTVRGYGRKPPLMPTEAQPEIVPQKAPASPATAPAEPLLAPAAPSVTEPAAASHAPANEIESLDPATIGVDAKRFQFKEGGDETGVTERLQGIEKWDPRLAGTALVYRDAEGKNWIADGHQRLGLAKRLMDAGHPPIRVNAFVLDAGTGITDSQARAIAAIKNIAEGTGSPVDAAKVLREAKDSGIDLPPLPPRSTLVRDGRALAELSPEAFGMVVNEVIPANQGAMIGRLVKNPAEQAEAARLLAKAKPDNATQAEMMIRDMLASGTDMMKQDSLFGEEAFASSIVLERAKVAEEALKQLRRDKSTFRTLVDEAERIEGQGANVLDQTANQSRLTTDEKAADLLTQLAFRAGPVSDELSAVSRRLKAGEISAAQGAREFLGVVRRAVEGGVDTGAEPRGAEPGAGGERPLDEGPELFQGNDYPLAPRSEWYGEANYETAGGRLTWMSPDDFLARAKRLEVDESSRDNIDDLKRHIESGKTLDPLKLFDGGKEDGRHRAIAAKELGIDRIPVIEYGDQIKGDQELFQPAPPIDTPEFNRWFGSSKVVDEHGAPLVVYHGSGVDIPEFKYEFTGAGNDQLGSGFYFTTDRGQAEGYTTRRNPDGDAKPGGESNPTVHEVYLSIKKPLDADANGTVTSAQIKRMLASAPAKARREGMENWAGVREEQMLNAYAIDDDNVVRGLFSFANDFFGDTPAGVQAFNAAVKKVLGYDGVVKSWDGSKHYVAFDPTQIKSTANRGTFDPKDPRILFQEPNRELWKPGEMFGGFETERGLEGLPQTLIPGVKPMTDAERIAAAAAKPLKGGAAPAKAGSLFDVEGREDSAAQRELFQSQREREFYQPAYHGTPHIFDKFDSTKIGTGEGAQAYGHGLYFASEKKVAEHYRKSLAGVARMEFDGTPVSDLIGGIGTPVNVAMEHAPDMLKKLDLGAMPEAVTKLYPDADKYASVPTYRALALREVLHGISDDVAFSGKTLAEAIDYEIGHWRSVVDDDIKAKLGQETAQAASRLQIAEALKKADLLKTKAPGRLYHVEVPEHHEMMDWDKPLSEQPEGVRGKLAGLGIKPREASQWKDRKGALGDAPIIIDQYGSEIAKLGGNKDEYAAFGMGADNRMQRIARGEPLTLDEAKTKVEQFNRDQGNTGEKIYQQLANLYDSGKLRSDEKLPRDFPKNLSGPEAASRLLRDAGIPGHQYVGNESGKTNYVIYDDSRVNVTSYEQQKRGSITFAENRKPLIKLFKDADASTFIHETGHQWLEELMRDAVHPAATDVVKTDAATVRKWLGIKEDGQIATGAHEKFARGFEQYVREGVAPSAALARVFAQFKTWLTTIYQSIKGLGSPINDDIKSVFDRMIEIEPNRTVIAAEREGERGLSHAHETEAADAAPHEAGPIGDRISAERDAYIAEQPPEVQNELAAAIAEHEAITAAGAEPGGEAGAQPAGGPEVVGGGGQPEAVAPGGAGGGEPGPVVPGSKPSVSESHRGEPNAGLREQRSGAAGAARPQPLAPDPATLFGPDESPFTDKAGNIRLDNLTTDSDVKQAIRDSAAENNDFIGDRRGVVTDGQVMDLADALGMDAAKLNTRQIGQAFNAEQVVAARKLLIESATTVSTLMKKAATGTDEDVMAYAQAKARHQMIQGQVAGITAEAGRALRAFRNIAGQEGAQNVDQFIRQATGKTLFQLREEAKLGSTLDTPGKVSKFMADSKKPDFSRMVLEYWINALVSGPRTQVTNVVSNAIFMLQKAGPETAAAAGIGAIRRAMGREGPVVRAGEVGENFRRMGAALPVALKASLQAVREGRSVELPNEAHAQIELPLQPGAENAAAPKLDENATYASLMPELFGMTKGLTDSIIAIGQLLKTGGEKGSPLVGFKSSMLGAIPDIQVRGTTVLPIGTTVRIPTRFLAAGDSFFRALNYSMEKGSLAYRAADEAGLTGQAKAAKIAELYETPTVDMMEQAGKVATELTFMSRRSEFVKQLSRLANTNIFGAPLLKFVTPFINTPANIIEEAILHRTPLGLFSPEIRADLAGKNGTIAQDTAMAKMLVGSAYAIAFGTMAAKGLMSGSGPSDSNARSVWRLAGNQPHSVRIGDIWYDSRIAGPIGLLAGMSADMYDVAHSAQSGDLQGVGQQLLHGFMQNILDASWMTGPSDLIQALEDPDRYGRQYVANFASSFVPAVMGQTARATDPYTRQARTAMDALKARVPGLSETLMPRRDIWGEALPSGTAFGPPLLSSVYTTQVSKDPVNLALATAGYWPGQPQRQIRGVDLTDEQYDQYSMIAGRMAKQRLDAMVRSSAWQTWPAQSRHDIISEVIRQSRETARGYLMAKFPQIASDAVKSKLAQLQGTP